MTDKKPCIRCERAIDPYAKICPYCNWDQSNVNVPAPQPVATGPAYVPPQDRDWRRLLMMAGGFVLLLIASFAVGAWINSDDAPKNAPEPITEQEQKSGTTAKRSDVTLVPVGAGDIEQPITSAPATTVADGVPAEYQRSDATAVSSEEYAQLAARAKAERAAANMVDPRTISGPAYAQAPRRQRDPGEIPPPMASASGESRRSLLGTRPVPEYQPLPRIAVSEPTTARLVLLIGTDGRVKEVNVRESIPGQTPKLIAAIQSWRFKPATRGGEPVEAPFTVDISFLPQ
jgi:hypothetical protein